MRALTAVARSAMGNLRSPASRSGHSATDRCVEPGMTIPEGKTAGFRSGHFLQFPITGIEIHAAAPWRCSRWFKSSRYRPVSSKSGNSPQRSWMHAERHALRLPRPSSPARRALGRTAFRRGERVLLDVDPSAMSRFGFRKTGAPEPTISVTAVETCTPRPKSQKATTLVSEKHRHPAGRRRPGRRPDIPQHIVASLGSAWGAKRKAVIGKPR